MLHKNIRLLTLQYFLCEFRLYSAILVIYFAQVTGSYALAMSILSVVMLSAATFEIPTGIFSDLIGRKRTIILGSIASVIFVTLYAWAGNYWILVLGGIFEGLSRAFWSGNNEALFYDSLLETASQDKFADYSGKAGSAGQAALAISSVLGGFVAFLSLPLAIWVSVIPQVLGLIVTIFVFEPKVHSKKSGNIYEHLGQSFKHIKHNYRLKLISLSSILRFAFGETAFQFKPVFVSSLWPIWAVGLAQSASFIFGSISFYFSGFVIRRLGALKALFIENINGRVLNFVALLFPTIASPALMSLTSLTYGVAQTAQSTLMQKEFTTEQRATLGSINSLLANIGFAIISFSIGLFADKIGVINTLLIAQIALILPVFIYWKIFHHEHTKDFF